MGGGEKEAMVSLPYVFTSILTHPACRPVNGKFGGVLGINNKKNSPPISEQPESNENWKKKMVVMSSV